MAALAAVWDLIASDHASGTFLKVGAAADEAAASTSKLSKGVLVGVAALGVAAGVVAAASIEAATKFQSSMLLIQTQAGASSAEVKKMSTAVLALAGPVATAPEALALSLYHIESTGLRGAQALDVLKIAAEGAKVGHADLEETTNALTATVVSGIGGIKNMGQAMGELNAIVGSGDMKLSDLNQALSSGLLTVVKGYGIDITDVGAALATFGDNNIRGADAATMLRMAVQAMAVPVRGGQAELDKLGIKAGELSKDMQTGGLNKALQDLATHLKDSGVQADQVGTILTTAFGKRAGPGLAVLESQLARFQSKLVEVKDGGNQFGSAWDATTKTVSFQFDQIRASVEALAIRLGDLLLPYVAKAATAVNQFFTYLTTNKTVARDVGDAFRVMGDALSGIVGAVKDFIAGFTDNENVTTTVTGWREVLVALGIDARAAFDELKKIAVVVGADVATAFKDAGPAVGALANAFLKIQFFIEGHAVLFQSIAVGVLAAAAAFGVWTLAIGVWETVTAAATAVGAAFDAVMDANPIMLVVLAVAALAAGMIYAYEHSKTFRDIVNDVGGALKKVWTDVLEPVAGFFQANWKTALEIAVAVFFPFIALPAAIYLYWGNITGFFSDMWSDITGFFSTALSDIVSTVVNAGKDVVNGFVAWNKMILKALLFFVELPKYIYDYVVSQGGLAGIGVKIWGVLVAAFKDSVKWLVKTGQDIMTGLVDGVETVWAREVAFWEAVPGEILGYLKDAAKWLVKTGQDIVTGMIAGIETIWANEVAFWEAVPGEILGFLSGAGSWLVKTGEDLMTGMLSGIGVGWTALYDFFTALPGTIISAIGDIGSEMLSVGEAIVQGIINGLGDVGEQVLNHIEGGLKNVVGGVKSFLGIHSPSTVFHEIGMNIMAGLNNGITVGGAAPLKSAHQIMAAMTGHNAAGHALPQTVASNNLAAKLGAGSGSVTMQHVDTQVVNNGVGADQIAKNLEFAFRAGVS